MAPQSAAALGSDHRRQYLLLTFIVSASPSDGGVFSIAPLWDSLPVPVTPLLVRPTAIKPGCFYGVLLTLIVIK